MSRPEIPVYITAVSKNAEAAIGRFTALARTSAGHVAEAFGRIKAAAFNLGTFGSALSLAGLVAGARQAASEVASIGDEAKRAGVSVKAFQELKFVAEQNRIGVDAMVDGLKELNLRADEFVVTAGGPAAEAFRRLGYSATALKAKLRDPSALFSEIIGRLGEFDRAAQIRIADEIFGGSAGERFVQLISQGESGIKRQISAANELGIVLDDKVVKKADEIDRKFSLLAGTISTRLKGAVVETATELLTWRKAYLQLEQAAQFRTALKLSDKLREIEQTRAALDQLQFDQKAFPEDINVGANIERLTQKLSELETEARTLRGTLASGVFPGKVKDDIIETTPAVNGLRSALGQTGSAAESGAKGLETYAAAIRELQQAVPELAKSLADLDAQAKINTAYGAAISKATSVQEVLEANALRNQANSALSQRGAREAASRGFLDLIGFAEGTDRARGYNETLDYGRYTGGNRNLVLMSLDDIDAMQSKMLSDPNNTKNSSAVGRYQIVQKTLRGLRQRLGLDGSELFSSDLQDRLAMELMRGRGNDPAGLRNEWEGLRRVDDATIRAAYDGTSVSMPGVDQGIELKNEKMREQKATYDEIIAGARQFTAEQKLEMAALGLTRDAAARLRYEQELLTQAEQAGLDLTPDQIAKLKALAAEMANAEERTLNFAQSQEELQARVNEFGAIAGGAARGFVQDLMNGKTAAEALKNALARLADQALNGALSAIFGGGGGGGGSSIFGSIVGKLLGLPGNANGTDNWRGGLTWVGEEGPELLNVRPGAQIIPNHTLDALSKMDSRDRRRAGGGGSSYRGGDVIIQGDVSEKNIKLIRQAIDENNQKLAYARENEWR
ncbi:hypothetical protein SAMN05892877_1278 [Rhizobium subbaraonis]|uniref:Tail length tape measure protein n=1 Tax=Rhizobium subbaraonis TaxID=908946 RepID=A0A285V0G6_9HYPH|nr:hypothetical protein [Rhizobium subbaraonis]SOC47098.1 hypothetical protein SAMN05892877_1278 [Rhizobium subbaraonis]